MAYDKFTFGDLNIHLSKKDRSNFVMISKELSTDMFYALGRFIFKRLFGKT